MSFPMPVLDDRTFQDIVDEAKRRIPLHTPEWTDHNVSDPGVALIELFAWMTESIIYRLNLVPDKLYRSFLDLLGIGPYAPQPAATPVTFWVAETDQGTHDVPAGARVATTQDPDGGATEFLTTHKVTIRQPVLRYALTRTDRSEPHDVAKKGADGDASATDEDQYVWKVLPARGDLRELPTTLELFSPAECFPSVRVGDAMYFGFEEPLTANVLQLDVTASTIEGPGVDPTDLPWAWEVSTEDGEWQPAEVVSDTTAGFNSSGHVTIFLPFEHTTARHNDSSAYWLRVRMTSGRPSYALSPMIDRIVFRSLGARAHAEQGIRHKREDLGLSTGKPDQSFHVRNAPVLRRPEHDEDGEAASRRVVGPNGLPIVIEAHDVIAETVEVIDPDGTIEVWQEVDDFARSGNDDPHFTWDSATGEIRFGPLVRELHDQVHGHLPQEHVHQRGKLPETGSRIVVTSYRSGGGAHGNVPADTIVVSRSPLPFVRRVNNRKPATGGVDPETVENAKCRGPLTLVTGDRAVTRNDFQQLVTSRFPKIKRARCVISDSNPNEVKLLVVPSISTNSAQLVLSDVIPDEHLITDIVDMLDKRRLIGTSIEVCPPSYRGVSIAARVTAIPTVNRAEVKASCQDRLYGYLHPLTGGPNGTGWRWGDKLDERLARRLLKAVNGVSTVEQVLFFSVEYDEQTEYSTGDRVNERVLDFKLADDELPLSFSHQVIVEPPENPDRRAAIGVAAAAVAAHSTDEDTELKADEAADEST